MNCPICSNSHPTLYSHIKHAHKLTADEFYRKFPEDRLSPSSKDKLPQGFWNEHPGKLKTLIEWFPHWGTHIMAKELSLSIQSVKNKADKLNLKMLPRSERLCYQCRDRTLDYKTQKHGKLCAMCFRNDRTKKRRAHISDDPLRERLKETLRTIKVRSAKLGFASDLTLEFLLDLWNRQRGLCYYTRRPMIATDKCGRGREMDTLSVDRVDSEKGYTRDNVVLATWWANISKQRLKTDDFIMYCRAVIHSVDGMSHLN